jgi:hypothetical protein
VQQESFRGLLVPLLCRSLVAHTLPAFHAMNAARKTRVEQAPTALSQESTIDLSTAGPRHRRATRLTTSRIRRDEGSRR